jgi:CHAT domain-containing protein
VLAGANQPTDADSGVLSGEAVAGLDLDGMDLAVLSACQTGLGETAAGEGVLGLGRVCAVRGGTLTQGLASRRVYPGRVCQTPSASRPGTSNS